MPFTFKQRSGVTNEERILSYLRRISPERAPISEIERHAGVHPHQQVYQITQRLLGRGAIEGVQDERGWWHFWIA